MKSRNKTRFPRPIWIAVLSFLCVICLMSCHESLEQRAAREAQEFTRKSCPTPEIDYTRTDSLTFDAASHTFTYHCTLSGPADDSLRIAGREAEMHEVMVSAVRNNMSIKRYRDDGYSFRYIFRSKREPSQVLFQTTVKSEDLQ